MFTPKADGYAARRGSIWNCIVILTLAPILAKAHLLFGLLNADPMLLYGGMHSGLVAGLLAGFPPFPTIDPNIAFTSQALGHRAALDVFSGHLPWWNHFEGVGAPLAGEMQSAALFPLTWLLLLPGGQLYFHITLQIIAGLSTWALLRKMGCTQLAAVAAAMVFQFNGTFAWLANAVINPIAFLPMVLLGVETIRERVQQKRGGGAMWVTIGLAASLYAGFPEVAYLNGLLIAGWTLVRCASLEGRARWVFLAQVGVAGAAGLAIAAPVLVAFFDYLPVASLGGHEGNGFASAHFRPEYLLAVLAPYAFGMISEIPEHAILWGAVGGYGGCVLAALALYGVIGRTHRGLRILLGLWVVLSLGLSYGAPGFDVLTRIIPGLGVAAFFRYLPPSWEFSLCVLAAFALSDLSRAPAVRRLWAGFALVALAVGLGVWSALKAQLPLHGDIAAGEGMLLVVIAAVTVTVAMFVRSNGARAGALAALLVLEAVSYFVVPTLYYPRRGTVELGGVRYMQEHIGLNRFTTMGPVQPNYGSYFGLASVNHNDLPIPKEWTAYIARHLDPNAPEIVFTGTTRRDPNGPTVADNLIANLDAYRTIGTRYVLAPVGALDQPPYAALKRHLDAPGNRGLTQVYADQGMLIFELADPAPYFSAAGCAVVAVSRDEVRSDCTSPSSLTRLEMFMDGWRATIDGDAAPVRRTGEIFQQVDLPAGKSTIRFAFSPPFIGFGYLAFVLGCLLLIGDVAWGARKTRTVS